MKTRSLPVSLQTIILIPTLLILSCGRPSDKRTSYNADRAFYLQDAQWTPEKAGDWYSRQPWLIGTNFIPSTAINPIEMWQESSYDPETIGRELGYANTIGMNTIRVFLHYLVWKEEGESYLQRIDNFLGIADDNHIKVMFVFFDDCWDPDPFYGKQKDPEPFVHNPGWVQCPGWNILSDTSRYDEMKPYVQKIMKRFAKDERIIVWDLYNEPGNTNDISYADPKNKPEYSLKLLENVFYWAREADPSQPLTTGVWTGDWSDPQNLSPLNEFSLDHSDVITFHCYHDLNGFVNFFDPLKYYNRPVICTEFMSRGSGGTFDAILPFMKENKIGGYNWGLVNGKTQTIYSWESWKRDISGEADFWHHDLLHKDGTPYLQTEVDLILELRKKKI